MEGSTRTRSPQTRSRSPKKQQMAAEGGAVTRNSGAVTRNRSKKDDISDGGGGSTRGGGARARATQSKVSGGGSGGRGGGTRGGGARARLAGQSKDNSVGWIDKGGVATMTPPKKGARTRANDDEGAPGGNAAVDKECALGGGQSKDNSGGSGSGARGGGARWAEFQSKVNSGGGVLGGGDSNDDEGALGGNTAVDKECALGGGQSKDNSVGGGVGGARGGGAKGVIGAAKEKRARANDVEEGGGGATKKQGRKLPLKRNQAPSTSVDAVLGGDASAAYSSGWARVAALEAPDTCVQCTWSFFKPCNFLLPPPVTCNMCSAPVHHLCQIIWENKHSYEPPGCVKYCPLHHAHYQ